MKVAIIGDVSFDNPVTFQDRCDKILSKSKDIELISSRTTSLDKLIEIYALANDYPVSVVQDNIEAISQSDAVIFLWDGMSEEIQKLITLAKTSNLNLRIARYE